MTSSHPFHLPVRDGAGGQRFCIFHAPQGAHHQAMVLYLHPFAEEMNKSRRMAALQCRALARAGCAVLQIDARGCGDSSGELADATWEEWIEDALDALAWLRERGEGALWLWGLRAGCLLASEVGRRLPKVALNYLFWSPVTEGRMQLQQFLRLKSAAGMLAGAEGGAGSASAWRTRLLAGESVPVAGYTLSPSLGAGLDRAQLVIPAPGADGVRMEWLELSLREAADVTPVAARALAAWQQAGYRARAQVVAGPAFWQTTEIEEAPDLLSATVRAVTAPASR